MKELLKPSEAEARLEDIRTTSSNIHELVARLKDFWKDAGIVVTFTSYPSGFRDSVSNTHNAPTGYPTNWSHVATKPEGYPGWSGTWEGEVEVLDPKSFGERSVFFSDLVRGAYRELGLPAIPWLKTGSGGGGSQFKFSGMLFIYDFPKMLEEFKANGGEFKIMQKEYCNYVDRYLNTFNKEQEQFVTNTKEYITCEDMLDELSKLTTEASYLRDKVRKHYKAKFVEAYSVPLEKPTSIFVDDSLIENTTIVTSNDKAVPLPELESLVGLIKSLSDNINDYGENHPEIFI